MATTPAGDNPALRKAIVRNLARKVAQQRAGAGTAPLPVVGGGRRPVRSLRATAMPKPRVAGQR